MSSSSVEARVLEAWRDLQHYAVNFDFQVGVQPLSSWQAPAVRREAPPPVGPALRAAPACDHPAAQLPRRGDGSPALRRGCLVPGRSGRLRWGS